MKRLAAVLTALPLFGAIIFTSSKALADLGVLTSITLVHTVYPNSDNYELYKGYLYTTDGKTIFWGGSYCSPVSHQLSPTDVQMLIDAAFSKKAVAIFYKQSASNNLCLTAVGQYNYIFNPSSNSNQIHSLPAIPKK